MVFDAFALRNRVVGDYRAYVESFIHVQDDRLRAFVEKTLAGGRLWPDAVLQLNPNYAPGSTLAELAAAGTIEPETARFFGPDLRLHRHQEEALARAKAGRPYVVSTGTGSGKSLTYLLPIVDGVFRDEPNRRSVRALVVYPMNALINSQLEALEGFKRANWPDCPLTFARYTGQDRGKDKDGTDTRNRLLTEPPHVLLTNYVMLEYILIRPTERALLDRMTRDLAYLAVDELHVYRGRQGADVAMLMRRLRQKVERDGLLCVGTSATIATGGDRSARRAAIAGVGTQLFGVEVREGDVVDETLQRVALAPYPADRGALAAAVLAPPPDASLDAVTRHPLTPWVEATFGLGQEDGHLVRRPPRRLAEGLAELTDGSGLPPETCEAALKRLLETGSTVPLRAGNPVFAFRLHQFLASGASIYATLDAPDRRVFDAEGHYRRGGEAGDELLYPLAFCRVCGQEHYMAALDEGETPHRLEPRPPQLNAAEDEFRGEAGYFSVEADDLWSDDEDLPDHWINRASKGRALKKQYLPHVPERRWARPDGSLSHEPIEGAIAGWWQKRPLMLCLRCRASYDLRQQIDFGKLVTLSQTGRSTATTILASSAIEGLGADAAVERDAQKLLSFTDNRQDAALQAGHTNDFVQVVLLRGALSRAVRRQGVLEHDELGREIFKALNLPDAAWQKDVPFGGGVGPRAKRAMVGLLDYLALTDLARSWRLTQPNLEQCGLLRITYDGLDAVAADAGLWRDAPLMGTIPPDARRAILTAILDHLRGALAIESDVLDPDEAEGLVKRVMNELRAPWTFDRDERPLTAAVALLPDMTWTGQERTIGLGWRSAIGRYLRQGRLWGLEDNLKPEAGDELVRLIVERLVGRVLTRVERAGEWVGVRLSVGALQWCGGDGSVPLPDPVRTRDIHKRRLDLRRQEPNRFFAGLYSGQSSALAELRAGEHTGQVSNDKRQEREKAFSAGDLALLCCSPTMELGVDIRDLSVVHLRNVPPSPANYAQRSGRGGKPALVLAFASDGSAHDRYYFRRQPQMIAGAVAPPRLDLANRDLVQAHLQSIWLGIAGLKLGSSMDDVLDRGDPKLPLSPTHRANLDVVKGKTDDLVRQFREVALACGPALLQAPWYKDDWLREVAVTAPETFDRAFERWREMYKAALDQRGAARREKDRPHQGFAERRTAEGHEREAQREIDLLLNHGTRDETDFYPYRYLASEGFIPGYNFPRLPLRTLVSGTEAAESIDRPRFLGLSEFGPRNVVYHEGRQHRVAGLVLPAGGIEARLQRAKLCQTCGYLHAGDGYVADTCDGCGASLLGGNGQAEVHLLDQPTARASRYLRISSEEEERSREGYNIKTYFRLTSDKSRKVRPYRGRDGRPLVTLEACPQAELWRINHGWRRSEGEKGFRIDTANGRWSGSGDDPRTRIAGIKPFVADTRNLLFVGLADPAKGGDEAFMKTLGYALRRAIQVCYQVEEQEIVVEIIGGEAHRRLLFWEAAEGGIGVAERLMDDPASLARLAREARTLLHVDPDTGTPHQNACSVACYECLLGYANQIDHRLLDRNLVLDFLAEIEAAQPVSQAASEGYEAQHARLLTHLDPASGLERAFVDALAARRRRLPDVAQYCPTSEVAVQVDFFYKTPARGLCIFVDGPMHDEPAQRRQDRDARERLEDCGFRVIVIRHDRPMDEQIEEHVALFGSEL